jgi:hypothetical protein
MRADFEKDDVYPTAGKICFEKAMLAIVTTSWQ